MWTWLASHWDTVLAVIAAAMVFADKFVRLTPTQIDDRIVEKVGDALEHLGVIKRQDDPPVV